MSLHNSPRFTVQNDVYRVAIEILHPHCRRPLHQHANSLKVERETVFPSEIRLSVNVGDLVPIDVIRELSTKDRTTSLAFYRMLKNDRTTPKSGISKMAARRRLSPAKKKRKKKTAHQFEQ